MKPEPIITVIRPNLTEEEREKRIKQVEKCISDFWLAMKRIEEKQRSVRHNESPDNV